MSLPLVSCICPTADRREFMPRAFKCFLAQDYSPLEMIVLDDGQDVVGDLVPDDQRIRYFYEQPKRNYNQKINRCAELASGEYIAHWDSDDWYAPDRVSRQILPLIENPELQVSGTSTLYYYRHPHLSNPLLQQPRLPGSLTQHATGAYQYTGCKQSWLGGIAYRRAAVLARPFDDDPKPGADSRWQRAIPQQYRFDCADPALIIAAVHGDNHSRKTCCGNNWRAVPWETITQYL